MINPNDSYWDRWLRKRFIFLVIAGVFTNITGLFVTILEPDGALYATIAKTIAQSGDFVNIRVGGYDWLDKPHFPFWITALSLKLFGINTIAYKLPALLFWMAGGLYTYHFAKDLYSKNIARIAVLIYLTAAHLVISNNDVRAEPFLTGLIIGSVYHFYKASDKGLSLDLILGSLLAACAMMTKGPFVLIVIASGFIIHWIVKKEWKQFLHYRWWVAILLIFVFILPELYCLYLQFDLHPEKIVFGKTGVSGIRFFFWDSQFGRFLNTGPIKGEGDKLFYVHTLLWAFLPWSILLFAAVFGRIRHVKSKSANENICLGGSIITFLLFSLSGFQLPHYIIIVFPFFSIISADYIYNLHRKKTILIWTWVQNILVFLMIAVLVILVIYFNLSGKVLIIIACVIIIIILAYIFRKKGLADLLGQSFMASIFLYLVLNLVFYPELLKYQSGSKAALFISKTPPGNAVAAYEENSYSFAYYLDQPFELHNSPDTIKARAAQQQLLIFTQESHLDTLMKTGLTINVLETFPHFHISELTGSFLNYKTRHTVTKKMVVARVSSAGSIE